ncbi:MAG: PEP-CTERM sorting domain-containing protein [Armatimonadota bacterium]
MKRLTVIAVLIAVACSGAFADYVDLDYGAPDGPIEEIAPGYYDFHYIYYRESPLAVGSTWSIYGHGFLAASGPTYWNDTPPVITNEQIATWTYDGGDDPQSSSYTTFDLSTYLPSGTPRPVPYTINGEPAGTVLGATPEPGTILLTLVGIGAIGARLRRRD